MQHPERDHLVDSPVLARAPWDELSAGDDVLRVTAVRCFLTAPPGSGPMLVARVETNQPGLYGLGCGSSPQRPQAIQQVLEGYLGPMLVGRRAADIEDFHQLAQASPYWRGGAIENNALAAIDIALWDIKGKVAGVPVHQLWGGQARDGVDAYAHAHGRSVPELIEDVHRLTEAGYQHVRCQIAIPDADTYGAAGHREGKDTRDIPWRSRSYRRLVVEMFDAVRESAGSDLSLLHDVHERLSLPETVRLARDLEPHNLFFLEDSLAPEDIEWYRELRSKTVTPLAFGETLAEVRSFIPLVRERLIDYARVRVSAVGGITPTLKLAHYCEFAGSSLALHGPPDVSPIGHAASIAIDTVARSFGIQESWEFPEPFDEVFPGTFRPLGGKFPVNQRPGLGVDFDERAAAKYPISAPLTYDAWSMLRHEDGTVARP